MSSFARFRRFLGLRLIQLGMHIYGGRLTWHLSGKLLG